MRDEMEIRQPNISRLYATKRKVMEPKIAILGEHSTYSEFIDLGSPAANVVYLLLERGRANCSCHIA